MLYRAFREAYEDESSQAIIRRCDMPQEYLAFARERVDYERTVVARLRLSID